VSPGAKSTHSRQKALARPLIKDTNCWKIQSAENVLKKLNGDMIIGIWVSPPMLPETATKGPHEELSSKDRSELTIDHLYAYYCIK
jgi:hypothetical protein